MTRRLGRILPLLLLFAFTALVSGCVLGGDGQAEDPKAHTDADGNPVNFVLELREPGSGEEVSEGDIYPHSTIDGPLIKQWTVPMYGNTVYESVVKFFEEGEDEMTFRLSQHRFYMFHSCTLSDGREFDLETVYIAADGEYADCANFQSILGEDGIAGTEDDLKILTLVYRGWLY